MTGTKNQYEAVVVFRGELDEASVRTQIQRVEQIVQAHGGTISKQDIWGRRQLSYKMEKRETGIYSLLVFDGDNSVVSDLERQLRINESVLRHLVVRKDKFAPDIQPGRKLEEQFSFEALGAAAAGEDDELGGDVTVQ